MLSDPLWWGSRRLAPKDFLTGLKRASRRHEVGGGVHLKLYVLGGLAGRCGWTAAHHRATPVGDPASCMGGSMTPMAVGCDMGDAVGTRLSL